MLSGLLALGDIEWGALAVMTWVVMLLALVGLAALQVYMLSELEMLEDDRNNLYDHCPAATRMALLDMGGHAALTCGMLLAGHWVLFLLQLPVLAWNARQYHTRDYEWDETQALDRKYKERKRNEMYAKCAFYSSLTVFALYKVIALVLRLVTGRVKGRLGDRSRPFGRWGKKK